MIWIRRLFTVALMAFAATTFALGIAGEVGSWTTSRAPVAVESVPGEGETENTAMVAPAPSPVDPSEQQGQNTLVNAPALPHGDSGGTDQPSTSSAADPMPIVATVPEPFVVAYYFHNTHRCVTCLAIEQRADEALQRAFPDELASRRLRWAAINMELAENQHVIFDYDLTSPSLVLVLVEGDLEREYRVLTRTWELIHQDQGGPFDAYVIAQTRLMLGELAD